MSAKKNRVGWTRITDPPRQDLDHQEVPVEP